MTRDSTFAVIDLACAALITIGVCVLMQAWALCRCGNWDLEFLLAGVK